MGKRKRKTKGMDRDSKNIVIAIDKNMTCKNCEELRMFMGNCEKQNHILTKENNKLKAEIKELKQNGNKKCQKQ